MSCPHGFVSRDKYTVQYACMEYDVTVNQFVQLMRESSLQPCAKILSMKTSAIEYRGDAANILKTSYSWRWNTEDDFTCCRYL